MSGGLAPKRLVHIQGKRSWPLLELYYPSPGENLQYSCLSYCWGGDQPVKLTKDWILAGKTEIPYESLPQTLKDAIQVTILLNLEYIWVDCLTIVQNDEEEKSIQINLMPQIFKNAAITIAASMPVNCHGGLFRKSWLQQAQDSDPNLSSPIRLPCRISDREGSVVLARRCPHWYENAIHRRAWTLQELVLSSRLVDFNSRHIVWSCGHGLRTQDSLPPTVLRPSHQDDNSFVDGTHELYGPFGLRDAFRALNSTSTVDQVERYWQKVSTAYSYRRLSRPEDKLLGISAIAQELQRFRPDDYVAGHWTAYLPDSLLWSCTSTTTTNRVYLAPTWSWASVGRHYHLHGYRLSDVHATILDVFVKPKYEEAPYGAVIGGHLVVKACSASIDLNLAQKECDLGSSDVPLPLRMSVSEKPRVRVYHILDRNFNGDTMPVVLIEIGRLALAGLTQGIILQNHSTEPECFIRIGYFFIYGDNECFDDRLRHLFPPDSMRTFKIL
ncbi:MAG: hypothetical protein Q9227_000977 [Pyrenula ochraceoflavens]